MTDARLKVEYRGKPLKDVDLGSLPLVVGRSAEVDLSFPDDAHLSRRHFSIQPEGDNWEVCDCGSKNGTRVNGEIITAPRRLRPGDSVEAGGVAIRFLTGDRPSQAPTAATVMFDPSMNDKASSDALVQASFQPSDSAGGGKLEGSLRKAIQSQATRLNALIEAGQALAGHRNQAELFDLVLTLSMDAVAGTRGVLMLLEDGELRAVAACGDNFHMSKTILDRVMAGESLLVADIAADERLAAAQSLVLQQVNGLLAIPLRLQERVTGAVYIDKPKKGHLFTEADLALLTAMGSMAATRIEHSRLVELEQREMLLKKELSQAAEIMMRLLPSTPPPAPGLEMDGRSLPCRSVGGDYFDYLAMPDDRIAVVVADVAGKGLPAALLVANLQARIQAVSEVASDAGDFVSRLNRGLCRTCPGNRFITLFLAIIDSATGEFEYCSAGHNPPMLIRKDGSVELLQIGGPVLGLLPNIPFERGSGKLEDSDLLVIYTDGVTEASNPADEEYGEDRLQGKLLALQHAEVADIVNTISGSVFEFAGAAPQADDITLVAVRARR